MERSALTVMSIQRDQHGGRIRSRTFQETERLALEQAKRVPWKQLAEAVEEYTEWQVFALWIRAVVEAEGGLPTVAVHELNARIPQFLSHIQSANTAENAARAAGLVIWDDLNLFVETKKFNDAKRGGWLDALRYFSSMSLRSMRAWSYWEAVDVLWRAARRPEYPDYAEWERDVANVRQLSNPESAAQNVLDQVWRLPGVEWRTLLRRFSDLTIFSIWLELIIDIDGPNSELASKELEAKYHGFDASPRAGSRAVVRALHKWVIRQVLGVANEEAILAALSFQVRNHPEYPAMIQYALHCHRTWREARPKPLPLFEKWREVADEYVEK